MKRIFIAFLYLYACSVVATENHKTIPNDFLGYWSSDLKYCKTDNLYNLEIHPKYLVFWESSGPAVSIVTKGKGELALIMELAGEGEEWLSFIHFKLISKKNQLVDISDPYSKNQLVRYRCPKKVTPNKSPKSGTPLRVAP